MRDDADVAAARASAAEPGENIPLEKVKADMMRDEQIGRMLRLLRHYWRANPDLRLGEIVWSAAGGGSVDHVEDADLEFGLVTLAEQQRDGQ